jgi:serine/threonine-protein kinase
MAIVMMHLHREPPPLREADPEIAPEIDDLVLSTLRKDPRQRPAVALLAARFASAAGRDGARDPDVPRVSDVTPEREATAPRTDVTTDKIGERKPD